MITKKNTNKLTKKKHKYGYKERHKYKKLNFYKNM